MYKYVFLDLDETILDFKKGQHDSLISACREYGFEINEKDCRKYSQINKEAWHAYERGEIEKSVMLVRRYEKFLAYKKIKGDPEKLNALYAKNLATQGILLPGAEEGLRYLRSKYRLSVITNGNTFTQYGRLHAAGLDDTFDHVFISDEVGYRKPDEKFFLHALEKSGATREETVVVGDNPTSDILGANKVGIDAVLFDYRANTDCPYPYIKKVYSWQELCQFL